MANLVLIRGNSGSGKTTLANALQAHFGSDTCLLLHQDQLRRELLQTNDHAGTLAIDLIADLIRFGNQHYSLVVLEGILRRDVYGEMLSRAMAEFDGSVLSYYLDVPFATTVVHNHDRFDEATLRQWWRPHDVLSADDIVLTHRDLPRVVSDLAQLS